MTDRPTLPATFRPQAWVNDHAIDADHMMEFDAFDGLMSLNHDQLVRITREIMQDSYGKDLDCLVQNYEIDQGGIAIPETDFAHFGPYRIEVENSDFQNTLAAIGVAPWDMPDAAAWDALRHKYKSAPQPEQLSAGNISDWRLADNPNGDHSEDLTDEMREPWQFEISRSSYDGLDLKFTAPDGTERSVLIEINQGAVKIATYGDPENSDDPTALIHVLKDMAAIDITSLRAASGARFDEGYIAVTPDSYAVRNGSPVPDSNQPGPKC